MRSHHLLATAALLLPTLFAHAAEPADRLAIVDQAIAFHGGELYRASETELDVCSLSGCFHVRALVDGDRFDYEVSGKTGDHERRVRWTSDELTRWQDGAPVAIEPDDAQGLRDWAMARVYFAFLPYRLNDPSVYEQDLGRETWDGRELHKVKVTFTPGSSTDADDEYLYWFDPENGRLEQFAYSFKGRPGGLRFRRAINYRRVGGLLFFDQENLGVAGNKRRVDEITPRFVADKMRPVSVVRFENVEVRPLR